jgi:glycosyltransferase involved in cell wall biosynthesis
VPFAAATVTEKVKKALRIGRAGWLARRFAPDVFVCVGLGKTANFIARALPFSTFTIAQDFIHGRFANDPLLESAANAFDAIGVQTPTMVTALRNAGFRTRPVNWVPCIPKAPVIGYIKLAATAAEGVRLAYFGRVVRHKGLDLLFEALAQTGLQLSVTLDIWGGGEDACRLTDRCKELGIAQVVSFRGEYPDGLEGALLMCSYDAIVVPSTGCEGLPLILIEAMAYGIPFLATDVGSMGECCEDNPDSVLVKPEADALREGLVKLVRMVLSGEFDPERLRRYYERRFSRVTMQLRWLECLNAPEAFFRVED